MTTLYATITSVMPQIKTGDTTHEQSVLLDNVTTTGSVQVNPTVLLVIKMDSDIRIPFVVGDPITVRGTYDGSTVIGPSKLATVSNVCKPNGFIRYKGRIYS